MGYYCTLSQSCGSCILEYRVDMNIPCCNPPSLCQDPATPVTNFSSEAADSETWIGRYYGQGLFPPLGSPWTSSGCLGVCESTVSQQAADECAQRQYIDCLGPTWPDIPTDPDEEPEDRETFRNTEQSCDFTCPDGNVFTYVIPAGTYAAFNQSYADAIAYSEACNRAVDFRICIGDLTPASGCAGSSYSGECSISGPVRTGQYSVSIVTGTLPPGLVMVLTGSAVTFVGTPLVAGTRIIRIQVEDPAGNFMQKDVTFRFVEISPATLTDAALNQAYAQALSTNIGNPLTQTYAIVDGALPAGMTLTSTGVIGGTPTEAGIFSFTVRMIDTSL